MNTYEQLIREARHEYGVDAAITIDEITHFLESLGAVPLSLERYWLDLVDEFVDPQLLAGAVTLYAPALIQDRANTEEKINFIIDPGEEFDPLEFGEQNREWTTYSHEIEGLQRLHIVLEHALDQPDRLGNFRIYGGGQWLRETLWAASTVLPRDVGSPDPRSVRFRSAFSYFDREPFTSAPVA